MPGVALALATTPAAQAGGAGGGASVTLANFFAQLYAGVRDDFTGTLGFKFTVGGSDVTVHALGRSVNGSLSSSHQVGLWTVAGSLVASVTVGPSSPVDVLGYAYEELGSPVVLTAGGVYVIGSEEVASGGDLWCDSLDISNHSAIVTVNNSRFSVGSFGFPAADYGGADTSYVPPTFFTAA